MNIEQTDDQFSTTAGKEKIVMEPIPIINVLLLLMMRCAGAQLRRTKGWGIQDVAFVKPKFVIRPLFNKHN